MILNEFYVGVVKRKTSLEEEVDALMAGQDRIADDFFDKGEDECGDSGDLRVSSKPQKPISFESSMPHRQHRVAGRLTSTRIPQSAGPASAPSTVRIENANRGEGRGRVGDEYSFREMDGGGYVNYYDEDDDDMYEVSQHFTASADL